MQDSFVADIGDFANHGILRALCGTPEKPVDGLKLGVVEYFNNPINTNLKNHGNRIEYLKVSKYNNSKYRVCDPYLYDTLQKLVGESLMCGTKLKIDPDRAKLLLPVDERYYDVALLDGKRKDWLKGAIEKIGKNTDIVFINPDNGIDLIRVSRRKYVHLWELKCFLKEKKSLIIYHHLGQGNKTEIERIDAISRCLIQELRPNGLWALRWNRAPTRAFFIVARTKNHKGKIEERLEAFKKSQWRKQGHFTVVPI